MPVAPFNFGAAQPVALTAGAPRSQVGRTLAGMRAELTKALGNRTGEFDAVDLDRWINDGYLEVVGMLDEPEFRGSTTITLIAGQPAYAFAGADLLVPTASMRIIDGDYERHIALSKITDVEAWRMLEDLPNEVELDPTHYFTRVESAGTLIVFYPVPYRAGTVTIDFAARATPLVNDDDSPLLELSLHRAVLEFAKSFAHGDLREYDFAGQAQNRAVGLIRTRLDRKAQQKHGVVGSVRPIRSAEQLTRRSYP